jgi:hypothetical protein
MVGCDGRPVAYIDASAVAVFAHPQPDGSYVVEICAREDITDRRLHLLLDGAQLLRANAATPVDAKPPVSRDRLDYTGHEPVDK